MAERIRRLKAIADTYKQRVLSKEQVLAVVIELHRKIPIVTFDECDYFL